MKPKKSNPLHKLITFSKDSPKLRNHKGEKNPTLVKSAPAGCADFF